MQKHLIFCLILAMLLSTASSCGSSANTQNSVEKITCVNNRKPIDIPGTPGIRMTPSRCEDYVFNPDALSKAIVIFAEAYSNEFDMPVTKVWTLLKNLKIEVSIIPRTVSRVYDIDGNFSATEVPVSGLAFSKDLIWVEVRTSQIWSSSLVHELVHIMIWRSQGVYGDPDHEGNTFSGWSKKHTRFIKEVKNILMDQEI